MLRGKYCEKPGCRNLPRKIEENRNRQQEHRPMSSGALKVSLYFLFNQELFSISDTRSKRPQAFIQNLLVRTVFQVRQHHDGVSNSLPDSFLSRPLNPPSTFNTAVRVSIKKHR